MKPTAILGKLLKVAAQAPPGAVPTGIPIRKGLPPQIPMRDVVPPTTSPAFSTYVGPQPLLSKDMVPPNSGKPMWNRPLSGYVGLGPDISSLGGEEAPSPLRVSGVGRELMNRGLGVVYPARTIESSVSPVSGFHKFLDSSAGPVARLPPNRMVALHEATHAVDPKAMSMEATRADCEVPAMTTEMLESIRQGYKPQSNLWIDQMKKHGPKLTGNDTQDVANIEQWMKQLRGDTTLGRKYKDWLAQYGNGAEPLPRR